MNPALARRARPALEALERRETPAFLAPVTSSGSAASVAVADFNHDGRDDVAAMGGTVNSRWSEYETVAINGQASVSLSNGNGSFQPPTALIGARGHSLAGFAVVDVNGDGDLDIE